MCYGGREAAPGRSGAVTVTRNMFNTQSRKLYSCLKHPHRLHLHEEFSWINQDGIAPGITEERQMVYIKTTWHKGTVLLKVGKLKEKKRKKKTSCRAAREDCVDISGGLGLLKVQP